jgi:hypothetical protein
MLAASYIVGTNAAYVSLRKRAAVKRARQPGFARAVIPSGGKTMRTIRVGVLLTLALAWLGEPPAASAQEHLMVAGVSLHLGMTKAEVLRKLAETPVTFKKEWDQGGCESWTDTAGSPVGNKRALSAGQAQMGRPT